ncbi:hypothetical protein HPP92_011304 [Vanilla planifolia]|uniref:Exostosin GT47 domain-containing protein n=1 Tax=Vanilla planifolia TaxID=51239 RepID=A0A835R6D7_VANPL|nr:hypothetical protein HPP92_011611 [Vanilla planifolia]KAG0483220.1 hypothetical protein HPP92_011304 [Vanilla planifolia]
MSVYGLHRTAFDSCLVAVIFVASAVTVFLVFYAPSSPTVWFIPPSFSASSTIFSSTKPYLSSASPLYFPAPLDPSPSSSPAPVPNSDLIFTFQQDYQGHEPFVYTSSSSPAPAEEGDSIASDSKAPSFTAVRGNSVNGETRMQSGDAKALPSEPKAASVLTKVDEELLYAKKEIERAPIVYDDPELYAPLFRNVSTFKRSYELMERILKVYIYSDGPMPIFHTPQLKGIYSSEGWFLKLMEENQKFVVKDPSKAHLFYLAYSSRKLEEALYKPNSHDMKPLLLFLKNYVNMLSTKYPFWNRTKGADHFIVACHDWGPYTTKWHPEFRKNTIKALCNADVSEGVFVRGKDVSLPETNIRMPKKPLRDIGGKRVSQRPILAFFAGNMHGRVRPILLDYWSGKDDDMKIYGSLPSDISKKMSYIEHMKSSKYCICPMGYEVNSPRIVEAFYYECVPVIIADNFVLPFEELLDWSAFSIVIAERDIPRLKEILTGISLRRYIYLQANVKRLQKHFLWHSLPVKYDIFHMILHSIWFNRLNQINTNAQ